MENKNETTMREKIPFMDIVRKTFSIRGDMASPEEIHDRIVNGGKVTGTNAVLLFLAIMIASIGLNTNSTAVIIGAMLVSPLMGTILALALGTVTADRTVAERSSLGFIIQVVIAIGGSTLFFLLSPIKGETPELLARTQPSIFDALLAFVGGLAGIIGNTREEKANNVIPGVAIATALMPPLCTCGYALANGRAGMFFNALYLFVINAYFIYTSAELVLAFIRLPNRRQLTAVQKKRYIGFKVMRTVIVMIPAVLIAMQIYFSNK